MSEKRGESDEVVGRGPRARRKVDEQPPPCTPSSGGHERRGCRARSPNTPLFFSDCSGNSPYNGTVPTTGNSLHRKHVMAAVGNGSQPFRRAALRQAQGDLPLPPPAGDMSDEAVGRGPRARRFSGNERNQANGTTRAVPERAAFRTVRG